MSGSLAVAERVLSRARHYLSGGRGAVRAASGSFSRESRRSEDPPWNNGGYNKKVLACGSSFISNDQNWLSDVFFLCSW